MVWYRVKPRLTEHDSNAIELKCVCEWIESIVEKRENPGLIIFHIVFRRLLFYGSLTSSQTSPAFYVSADKSLENTAGKGEITRNEEFLLSPPFWRTFCHSHQNCPLQTLSDWKGLIFFWERVKSRSVQ